MRHIGKVTDQLCCTRTLPVLCYDRPVRMCVSYGVGDCGNLITLWEIKFPDSCFLTSFDPVFLVFGGVLRLINVHRSAYLQYIDSEVQFEVMPLCQLTKQSRTVNKNRLKKSCLDFCKSFGCNTCTLVDKMCNYMLIGAW